MTLTFELGLDKIKKNQCVKYQDPRSSASRVVLLGHKHTHTQMIALPGPLKWLLVISCNN